METKKNSKRKIFYSAINLIMKALSGVTLLVAPGCWIIAT